jgi:hypothetical protein
MKKRTPDCAILAFILAMISFIVPIISYFTILIAIYAIIRLRDLKLGGVRIAIAAILISILSLIIASI